MIKHPPNHSSSLKRLLWHELKRKLSSLLTNSHSLKSNVLRTTMSHEECEIPLLNELTGHKPLDMFCASMLLFTMQQSASFTNFSSYAPVPPTQHLADTPTHVIRTVLSADVLTAFMRTVAGESISPFNQLESTQLLNDQEN